MIAIGEAVLFEFSGTLNFPKRRAYVAVRDTHRFSSTASPMFRITIESDSLGLGARSGAALK